MQLTAEDEGRVYDYTENVWTGKKELTLDGVPLEKINKKTFSVKDDAGNARPLEVKGNFLTGVTLTDNGKNIVLAKNKWYEWVLIFLPCLGIALGILCGAIGGGLSALCCLLGAVLNANILRGKSSLAVKIIACVAVFVVCNAVWFLICLAVAGGIGALLSFLS